VERNLPCFKVPEDARNPQYRWYDFRPDLDVCHLASSDTVRFVAHTTRSAKNSVGDTFPEYGRIWADGVFRAVLVSPREAAGEEQVGTLALYNQHVSELMDLFNWYGGTIETIPNPLPLDPAPAVTDVTVRSTLPDGRGVEVVMLRTAPIPEAGPDFDARYNELSRTADLIGYVGHSGVGNNVAAFERRGDFTPGQYQMVYLGSCSSFSYGDGTLVRRHRDKNPDDPMGTRYLDMFAHGEAAYGVDFVNKIVAGLIEGKSYQEIIDSTTQSYFAVVWGDEDNPPAPMTTVIR
jgi:hypothetical protein